MAAALPHAPAPLRSRRRLLLRQPRVAAGLLVLALAGMVAMGAPWIAPQDPLAQDISQRLVGPGAAYPLGTDHLGRDLLSRLIYGSRISLLVGLATMLLGGGIGMAAGFFGGYFGRWADRGVILLIDVFLSFSTLLLAFAFIAILGSGTLNLILAIALAVWPSVARVARGEALRLRGQEFVEAARALGASDLRILRRHIIPNALGPLAVVLPLGVGTAILSEASLSFLGLGVPPPSPTWGRIVGEGMGYMRTAPWAMLSGGTAIALVVLALNLVSDGVRDALDPYGVSA